MLEDNEIENISEVELKNLAINCYSCIKENGKKINYMAYIKSTKNVECNNAINNVYKKINIDAINNFIDEISSITIVRKEFYKQIIGYRYEILKNVYNKLNNI